MQRHTTHRIGRTLFALLAAASLTGLGCDGEDEPVCEAVASCDVRSAAPSISGEVGGYCMELTGSGWTTDIAETICPASVATYSASCCSLEGAVAKCIVAKGTLNEWVEHYYADKGWTLAEAEEICAGSNTGDNEFVPLS